jgi:hypothetical protein
LSVLGVHRGQASWLLFVLAALRFWSIAQAAITHKLTEAALQASLALYSSEISTLRQNAVRDYEDLVTTMGALRTAQGIRSDALDARLKELDELCRPLLMLETATVTWTFDAFVAWAEPLLARPDAVNTLTTEIIDISIATMA